MDSTSPALDDWPATSDHHRRSEVTGVIGRGEAAWLRASADVLRWKVKTESGFRVDDTSPVTPGRRQTISARVAGVTVREPVRVVEVISGATRSGFSYRTLPGHPVSGEEAFIVHRDDAGVVSITIRSLTRPAPQQPWRSLYPLLRVAQLVARRRYLRALRQRANARLCRESGSDSGRNHDFSGQ